MGDESVVYRSKLVDPIENDLSFHSRPNLARYDRTLKFYGVLSQIRPSITFKMALNICEIGHPCSTDVGKSLSFPD